MEKKIVTQFAGKKAEADADDLTSYFPMSCDDL
jgi:hypothetical protein